MQAHEQAYSKHKQDGKRLCGICHVECVARLGGEQESEKEIYVEQILVVHKVTYFYNIFGSTKRSFLLVFSMIRLSSSLMPSVPNVVIPLK